MRLTKIIQASAIGAMLAAVGLVACYNPEIESGDLQCSPKKECPRGFTCDMGVPISLCLKSGSGGLPGTGGAGGTVVMGGMGGQGGMCVLPIVGCNTTTPPGGGCDEVCQVGCQCNERCSLSGQTVACQPDPGGRLPVGQACAGGGTSDNCAPGLVCLEEPEPVCGNRCFRFCADDSDCGQGAHCTVPLVVGQGQVGVKVCDVPPDACNPTHGEGKCARADRPDTYGCYLMGTGFPNATVCDCAGTTKENQPCEVERECEPGLFCVVGTDNVALCRRVCPLNQPVNIARICGPSRSCVAYTNSERWGTCQ